MTRPLRVAVVARSVFPLHGLGGLERSVYDLVRHLARAGVEVTLITRPSSGHANAAAIDPRIAVAFVPYRTFPGAGPNLLFVSLKYLLAISVYSLPSFSMPLFVLISSSPLFFLSAFM